LALEKVKLVKLAGGEKKEHAAGGESNYEFNLRSGGAPKKYPTGIRHQKEIMRRMQLLIFCIHTHTGSVEITFS